MPTRKPKKSFEMRKINGVEIRQRQSDGYIDAVGVCDACDKDFSDYAQARFTKRFITELSKHIGKDECDLIQKVDGVGEIWVHPQVALNLSQWASPKLAVKIPEWILEWRVKQKGNGTTAPPMPKATSSGVRFEDIDPGFAAMIGKAAKFNPDK